MALAESLVAGRKTLSASDTAERLTATSQTLTGVIVKALAANAGVLYVGPQSAGANGYPLEAKEWVAFDIIDPSAVYVYGTAADGVAYLGLVP